jgi:hypothetical protein
MAAIEGDHADDEPYPLGSKRRRWTSPESLKAQKMRAEGIGYTEIAASLRDRTATSVKKHLRRVVYA